MKYVPFMYFLIFQDPFSKYFMKLLIFIIKT